MHDHTLYTSKVVTTTGWSINGYQFYFWEDFGDSAPF